MAGGGEIRVLLVGADREETTATARQLEAQEPSLAVETANSAAAARGRVGAGSDSSTESNAGSSTESAADSPIECVLVDSSLGADDGRAGANGDGPGADDTDPATGADDGLALLAHLREDDPTLPVVYLTDSGDEAGAREAFAAGATDYVELPDVDESGSWRWPTLARRIETAVGNRRARERTERERRERERRLDAVLERSPWPIYLKDLAGHYQLVNEAAAGLFGLSVADFEGDRTDTDLFDAETAADIRARDEQVIETGEPVEYESQREIDGETRHLHNVKAPYVVDGEVRGVVGFSLDITPLREREAELRAERDHVAALFSNIGDAVIEYELDGIEPVIRRVNPAFEDVFGYDAETVEGEYLDDFVVPPERETEAEDLNAHVAAGNALETEVTRQTADGEREFRLVSVPIEDGEADPANGYAIYSDITELTERERELRRQNERLEEFASVVGHDLQNPLMVAEGALELLRADVTGDADAEGHLETVDRALSRMSQLLSDLLTLARSGQAVEEFEPVVIEEAVESAWTTVETADATLACDCAHTVLADPSRLRQLLENCFRNAVEHGGESVTVRVEARSDGFAIADSGPGIPEDELGRVFESGYSTAETGTGFGLAIVEDIAEAHGWAVAIEESEVGGAAIVVTGIDVVADE